LATVYGDYGSEHSHWSAVALTSAISGPSSIPGEVTTHRGYTGPTSLLLKFKQPYDDGGSPIIGYHVFAKSDEPHFFNSWHWHGERMGNNVVYIFLKMVHVSINSLNVSYHFSL
jgi:hypothetical protein